MIGESPTALDPHTVVGVFLSSGSTANGGVLNDR